MSQHRSYTKTCKPHLPQSSNLSSIKSETSHSFLNPHQIPIKSQLHSKPYLFLKSQQQATSLPQPSSNHTFTRVHSSSGVSMYPNRINIRRSPTQIKHTPATHIHKQTQIQSHSLIHTTLIHTLNPTNSSPRLKAIGHIQHLSMPQT